MPAAVLSQGWRGWLESIQEKVKVWKGMLHGKERRKMREKLGACVAARDAARAEGKVGRVIKAVLGREGGSPLIGQIRKVNEGGGVEVWPAIFGSRRVVT